MGNYFNVSIFPQTQTPITIASCKLWLDAADLETIYSVANAVSIWRDKSGNKNNATQGTAINQPSTNTASILSNNVVVFNGSSSFMNLATSLDFIDATIFFVYNPRALGSPVKMLLSNSSVNKQLRSEESSVLGVASDFNNWLGGASGSSQSSLLLSVNTTAIVGFVGDTILKFYLNNISQAFGSARVNATAFPLNQIGAFNSISSFLNAYVCEIVFYNRILSDSEISILNRYFSNKWGIAIS